MNNLQRLESDTNFCVTLNLTDRIDPAKVIRTIQYSHPVFTPDGVAAQRRHGEISGVNRTHYCGAYWRWGFHEDGVVSALNALRGVGRSGEGAGGMSASAIYDGWVRHRRHTPVEHSFTYRHAMLLLDLDELPGVLDRHPLYSASRRAPVRFRREDYMGDPARPLAECVRDLVEERTGERPSRARCACSPRCARSATTSTRSASTTASRPAASGWRPWWRR